MLVRIYFQEFAKKLKNVHVYQDLISMLYRLYFSGTLVCRIHLGVVEATEGVGETDTTVAGKY